MAPDGTVLGFVWLGSFCLGVAISRWWAVLVPAAAWVGC
jgi:hypothetical protein